MTSARKDLPAPSGGADLTELLRRRRESSAPPAEPAPAPKPARPPAPAMERRSWYLPAASAAALARAVDDLHFATRQPKHAVLAALVAVALDHQDEARERLASQE